MSKIELKYCKNDEMIPDILAKGIGKIQFAKLRTMIGLRNIFDCEWGGEVKIEHSYQIIEEHSWRTFMLFTCSVEHTYRTYRTILNIVVYK